MTTMPPFALRNGVRRQRIFPFRGKGKGRGAIFPATCGFVFALLSGALPAGADSSRPPPPKPDDRKAAVRDLLFDRTHGLLPYPFPAETSLEELDRVLAGKFDTVGILFCGPYRGGEIDFDSLDRVLERIARAGSTTLLNVMPRFLESEGIRDRLSDGRVLAHAWNRSPNYAILDVFDPEQTAKFRGYLAAVGERYGHDERIAGFTIHWGYLGETGFFIGDFTKDSALLGTVSAGYSVHALRAFNAWRGKRGLDPVPSLPDPTAPSPEFVRFMRFRYEAVSKFQADAVETLKRATDRPVGIFAYLPADKASYARAWTSTPNADFYRSAASAATYDLSRTLSDSAIGWEDSGLHAGGWDFSFAAIRRDEIRMMALGAVFHAMWYRGYETESAWERGLYERICRFIREEAPRIRSRLRPEPPIVGLFLPTWSCAAWPPRSAEQPFLPSERLLRFIRLHVGIVESFGVPYRLLVESDLEDPASYADLRLVLIVAGDRLDDALGEEVAGRLRGDEKIAWIDFAGNETPSRTRIRSLFEERGIPIRLDHEGDLPIVGRVGNAVFNFRGEPTEVRFATAGGTTNRLLRGHEVLLLDDPRPPAREESPPDPG